MKSRDLLFALFSIIISSPGSKAQDSYLDLLFSTCWGLKRENSIENYEPQIDQDVEDDAKFWKWENIKSIYFYVCFKLAFGILS